MTQKHHMFSDTGGHPLQGGDALEMYLLEIASNNHKVVEELSRLKGLLHNMAALNNALHVAMERQQRRIAELEACAA